MSLEKPALRAAIIAQLHAELSLQTRAAQLARDEDISEESRAESKYDTHSQEAAYLAEGQARLAGEVETSISAYAALSLPTFSPADAIALGAVIELAGGGAEENTWYFLGPRAGGLEVTLKAKKILVITPQSPVGRELLGRRVGDNVRSSGRAGATLRIVSVA